MKRTSRGFAVYGEFKDGYGQTVRVQESSSAEGAFCWVFCKDQEGNDAIIHLGKPHSRSPHLSRAQARRLAKLLLKFADEARR